MATWELRTLIDQYKQQLGICNPHTQSPMEALFLQEAKKRLDGIVCQHQIGRYRVDFALPKESIAIEIDGRAYHSTVDQILADHRRQKEIERLSWTVIRFTGSQVWNETRICIQRVRNVIGMKRYGLL